MLTKFAYTYIDKNSVTLSVVEDSLKIGNALIDKSPI